MDRDPFKDQAAEYKEEVEDDKTEEWEEEDDMINQPRVSLRSKNQQTKPILFWAALVFIVFAFFFMLIQNWNKVSKTDIKRINESLAQMETRLAQMEQNQKSGTDLQMQLSAVVQAMKRLESSDQTLQTQVTQLSDRLSRAGKPVAQASQPSKQPAGKRYHIVQKGDTLFRIAQKYGKKVADLQKLNNIAPKQEIFPGQKLLVE